MTDKQYKVLLNKIEVLEKRVEELEEDLWFFEPFSKTTAQRKDREAELQGNEKLAERMAQEEYEAFKEVKL